MRSLVKLAVAAGVVLVASGTLEAQYPAMPGATIGTPMGYSYGYPNFSSYGYGVPDRGPMAAPAIRYRPINPYGYVNRPYYGAYGYGNYSNGSRNGFAPFRGRRFR